MAGEWVEAPSDRVNKLRDQVRERLAPMTPDAESWDEHRTWHILGHTRAIASGHPLNTWREEVLAARKVREEIREGNRTLTPLQATAENIGKSLHSVGLDGRALDSNGLRKARTAEYLAILPALLLAILAAPLTLFGSGIMILIGKVLGDSTDEGLDARTTYHFLASLLGPLIIWPIPIVIFIIAAIFGPWTIPALQILITALLLPLAFHLSNKVAIIAWDLHVVSRDARRLNRLRRDSESQSIRKDIVDLLAALK